MLNHDEQIIAESRWGNLETCETFSKVSNELRASWSSGNQEQQTIWNTAVNVIGPVYTAFTWWLLKKAHESGIKRLYFMARDGLIIKEIADRLICRGHLNIETRSLYVSRQSLLYASVTSIDQFDIRWFMWNPLTPLTVRKILERLEIPPTSCNQELARYKLSDLDRPLSLTEKFRMRKIFNEPELKSAILENAKARQKLTFAYLQQEGMAEDISFAVVDLGWLALSQYALSRILDQNGKYPQRGVQGYYLGTNWLLQKYKNDRVESFLFNPGNMLLNFSVVQYELPEIFATAQIGRTLGYQHKNGVVSPVFGQVNSQAIQWGSEIQNSAIIKFAEVSASQLPVNFIDQASPNAKIGKLFSRFFNSPSILEAETYGKFVHDADIEAKNAQGIAPMITIKGLPKIFSGYYWAQGAIKRSALSFELFWINCFLLINILRHLLLTIFDKVFNR